jgi:hypothetical protein
MTLAERSKKLLYDVMNVMGKRADTLRDNEDNIKASREIIVTVLSAERAATLSECLKVVEEERKACEEDENDDGEAACMNIEAELRKMNKERRA